jgi:type I restriction enzyme S subunit
MEKYDTYKDSGIEWIGAIPAHWEVKRLKYLVNDKLKYGANESALYENREDPRYIRITDFGHNGKLKRDTFKSLPLQTAKEYLLESGDILLARSGATVGKTFQFKDYEGLACFAGYLIKASPNEKIVLSDFLYLYTKSSFYDGWKESIFNKATIQNIGADKYAFLEVPLPPKSEQSKIANYLDKKTAEIDDLIAQKKKLLQLYKKEKEVIINQAVTKGINPDVKLKKSGVEYIGQIPEQWDIKKLRYLGKCANGISKSGDQFGFGFPFISYGDVYKNRILPKSVDGLVNSSETDKIAYSVIKGDVLFTRTSETIEEIGLASTCIHSVEDAVFAGFLIRFRPFKDILFDGFSNYYFSAQIHRRFFVKEMNLVTRASLSQELLKRLPVALPSIEEQKEIAEFLDKYISEIESKSTKTKKLIALLTEYKTALISEVVTGKIKIN